MRRHSVGTKMKIHLKTELPGPKSRNLMELRKLHVAQGPFHVTPIFVESARGATLTDVDGNVLIDFASGIGVVNVGHCPTLITNAIEGQAKKFLHVGFNVTPYEIYIRLAEKLNRLAPGNFTKKSFLANSGAEAVENAIKIARAYTQRPAVVCFEHAFHGRTYMAMSLTSKAKPYKAGFGPFCSEIYRTPFPYAYRWPTGSNLETVSEECFGKFEELIQSCILPNQVAAVIIEPVLGEGGFVPAPSGFLSKLRHFCSQHGIVLIADEIQTGMGRTGTLFACEQFDFVPDLIVTAKGLGGGMPISAVTGRAEMMDSPMEGAIGGTFGGNPVACAAALATLGLLENSEQQHSIRNLGVDIRDRMARWPEICPLIGDIRGLGPMQAAEFVKDKTSKEPDPVAVKRVIRYCYERGVIVMGAGTYGNVLRLLPPLVIEKDLLDEGLSIIELGLRSLCE